MGLLDQIDSKPPNRPPRIVIFSKGGVGKTTFAASVPGVVVCPAEEGEGILEYPKLPRPMSFADVVNGINELRQAKHAYKAYALDTVDKIEPLVWEEVCTRQSSSRNTYRSIEDFGYGKGYIYADPLWAEILRGLDGLRRERGMTTIVLAHSDSKTVEDPILGAYEQIQTKLHKRANALLHEWADIVGYAEIERSVRTDDEGKRDVRVATTTGRRILHLEDRGGFAAKNRYRLPSPLPLEWKTLRAEIQKVMKPPKSAGEAKAEKTEGAPDAAA